ncbi:C39 family peptidase [Streptomyces spiramenti]|uniref:Peptidase C39 family protein n=1 Tax=Streptomyces spiramenti TaxID=2720606 RepID=A0ABX1ATN4_9ACTN|nr:peptidase C39 family protein [Streptomyces spiramenti]
MSDAQPAPATPPAPATAAVSAPTPSVVELHVTKGAAGWSEGVHEGTTARTGPRAALVPGRPSSTLERRDARGAEQRWRSARWTSPEQRLTVPATELVVSWNADVPRGCWVRVEVRATRSDGPRTPWYPVADWAATDEDIAPASAEPARDDATAMDTDTLAVRADAAAGGVRLTAFRVRLTLCRRPGARAAPAVRRLAVMASAVPDRDAPPPSPPGEASGVELAVPPLSQYAHEGRYPHYNGGGAAWCSPASLRMVLAAFGRHPERSALAWVEPGHDDPDVCHAARRTFDHRWGGCGNWPFNTAHAASYRDMNAVVTRLESLTAAEGLLAAGLPLITSQSFEEGELPGAGYATAGHLMVLSGFTADGDVVAHDPAGRSRGTVRRVYPRRAFETVWLRTTRRRADGSAGTGSGGICYVLWPEEADARRLRALARVGVG